MIRVRNLLAAVVLCATMLASFAASPAAAAGVEVRIIPVDSVSKGGLADACFVLQDYSNEGCDDNHDGAITFKDIPPGQYTLVQTQSAYDHEDIAPMVITVDSSPARQDFIIPLVASSTVGSVVVYLSPIDVTTGLSVTTSCFVLVDFSNEGCDENGDGVISFDGVPPGIYGVTQTQVSPGYLPLADFRIDVHSDRDEQIFQIELTPTNKATGTVDVAVVPYDATTGGALTGACVQFEGGSNIGCDENGDGRIDFKGMPVGSYQLVETTAPAGFSLATPRIVSVTQDGQWYYLEHYPSTDATPLDNVDVAVVTRDPDDGSLLNGACYLILNASVKGCDENNDGQVDFKGVVPGTYELQQVSAPSGFSKIDPFLIQVSQYDPDQSILVKQATEQNKPGERNVSVVLWNITTGQRITGPDACVQLADWSNVGCDTNSDGQIDFQDVPVGTYPIKVTSLPDGYRIHFSSNKVVVEDKIPFSIVSALLTVEGA